MRRKTNRYDLSGDVGIGWTSNTNRQFYFDLNDYELIKDYSWHECVMPDGYCVLRARKGYSHTKFWYELGCKRL